MAQPQSETARKLFRALGKPAGEPRVVAALVQTGYNNYLRALGVVQFKKGRAA